MMGYSPQLCPMYPRIEVCLNHLEPLGSEMTEKDVRLNTSEAICETNRESICFMMKHEQMLTLIFVSAFSLRSSNCVAFVHLCTQMARQK